MNGIQWLGAVTMDPCSQTCENLYGEKSAKPDVLALIACFAQCDAAIPGQPLPQTTPPVTPPNFTLPGGIVLPPGFTIPAGWMLPQNLPLPPGMTVPSIPGMPPTGQVPATGWTLPFPVPLPVPWTLPQALPVPADWTIPQGLPMPPGVPQLPPLQPSPSGPLPPPPAPKEEPKPAEKPAEKKTPWGWIILGGAAVVAAVGIALSAPTLGENPRRRPIQRGPGKFLPGQVVATPGALASVPEQDIALALVRHVNGDWGNLDPEDWKANDVGLRTGDRLLSSYKSRTGVKFWIITEADRSVTTVLLPSEY